MSLLLKMKPNAVLQIQSRLTDVMVVLLYAFFFPDKALGLGHHGRRRFFLTSASVASWRLS